MQSRRQNQDREAGGLVKVVADPPRGRVPGVSTPSSKPERRPDTGWMIPLCAAAYVTVAPFAAALQWEIRGVLIDPSDLVLLPVAFWLLARIIMRPTGPRVWANANERFWWCLYGALVAAAYFRSVNELGYVTSPVSALYQFYRYCWQPMLLYPVAFYVASRPLQAVLLIGGIMLAADVNAVSAIWQGRSGLEARGLFELDSKNMLGGSLLIPSFLGLAVAVFANTWPRRAVGYASLALSVGAIWYSVSRGATVGFLCGLAASLIVSKGRWRFLAVAVPTIAVILFLNQDFGRTSGIRATYMEIANGADAGTMRWRIEQRWPYFVEVIRQHPWLGTGSAVDEALGQDANTPHNGYLALSARSGIPATILYLTFIGAALTRAWKLTRTTGEPELQAIGLAAIGGLTAVCVHNVVDSTFESGTVAYLVWVICAIVARSSSERQAHREPTLRPVASRLRVSRPRTV